MERLEFTNREEYRKALSDIRKVAEVSSALESIGYRLVFAVNKFKENPVVYASYNLSSNNSVSFLPPIYYNDYDLSEEGFFEVLTTAYGAIHGRGIAQFIEAFTHAQEAVKILDEFKEWVDNNTDNLPVILR